MLFFACSSESPDDFPCNQNISFPESKQRVCNPRQLKRLEKSESDRKVKQICALLSAECIQNCSIDSNPDSCIRTSCKTFLICTSGIYLPPFMFR